MRVQVCRLVWRRGWIVVWQDVFKVSWPGKRHVPGMIDWEGEATIQESVIGQDFSFDIGKAFPGTKGKAIVTSAMQKRGGKIRVEFTGSGNPHFGRKQKRFESALLEKQTRGPKA